MATRQVRAGGRRPAVWSPGEVLAIDWGEELLAGRKVHVFCAVLSRFRFVRFETDEQQATSPAMPAECFEILGGVPKVVLADRVGCMKGGVVANIVVPDPDYVRYATHYRFRPDFCHAVGPESKSIVENLVGYAKDDLGGVRIDDPHYDRLRPTTPPREARCQDACRAGVPRVGGHSPSST